MRRTADEIMVRGGFAPTDTGPYVTELREQTRKQVERGMLDRSPGSWGPAAIDFKTGKWKIDAEARAKALLSIEWNMEHGHSCRVECIDGTPWHWTFNMRTMQWRYRIEWDRISSWFGDLRRRFEMKYRIWRDRHIVNPYE
jgi:hypothetical protein